MSCNGSNKPYLSTSDAVSRKSLICFPFPHFLNDAQAHVIIDYLIFVPAPILILNHWFPASLGILQVQGLKPLIKNHVDVILSWALMNLPWLSLSLSLFLQTSSARPASLSAPTTAASPAGGCATGRMIAATAQTRTSSVVSCDR